MVQQQILDADPAADLAVYAIWLPILPTDARDQWDGQLLADPRVTHLWDQERTVGRWLADDQNLELGDTGDVVWDAFLLFGPEARWERAPSGLLAWGAPIAGHFPELADALAPLLEEPAEQAPSTPRADRNAVIAERHRYVLDGRREVVRADHARFGGI